MPTFRVKLWALSVPDRAEMLGGCTLGVKLREGAPLSNFCDTLASDEVSDWVGLLCGRMTWICVISMRAEPLIAIIVNKSLVILGGTVRLSSWSPGGGPEVGTGCTWLEF